MRPAQNGGDVVHHNKIRHGNESRKVGMNTRLSAGVHGIRGTAHGWSLLFRAFPNSFAEFVTVKGIADIKRVLTAAHAAGRTSLLQQLL